MLKNYVIILMSYKSNNFLNIINVFNCEFVNLIIKKREEREEKKPIVRDRERREDGRGGGRGEESGKFCSYKFEAQIILFLKVNSLIPLKN